MLVPGFNRVIVRVVSGEKTTASGLVIASRSGQSDYTLGQVVGDFNGYLEDGKPMPLTLSDGDHVYFYKSDRSSIYHEGETLYSVHISEIGAVVS